MRSEPTPQEPHTLPTRYPQPFQRPTAPPPRRVFEQYSTMYSHESRFRYSLLPVQLYSSLRCEGRVTSSLSSKTQITVRPYYIILKILYSESSSLFGTIS